MSDDEEQKKVQGEVEIMIKSLSEGIGEEESKAPEPKTSDAKASDAEPKTPDAEIPPKETPPKEVPPKETPPPEVPPKEVPPKETPPVVVLDEKDKIIESLRAKLAEKEAAKSPEKPPEKLLEKPPEKPPEKAPAEVPITFEDQDFVASLDMDELTRDPKEFNKLLNKLYQKAVTDSRRILGESVLRSIPDIVRANLTMMTELQKLSDKFYEDNQDLKPFKKVVAAVFEEVASEHPDKKYNEIVEIVGPEVRKRLDLQKKVITNGSKDNPPPKLPHKGGKAGRPQEKPSTEPLQAELEEMNKTLGR